MTGGPPGDIGNVVNGLVERVNVSSIVTLTDSSFGWRMTVWQTGLQLWLTQPIFGTGLGLSVQGLHDITWFNIPMRDVHNNYLGILIQLGIIGFLFVVAWFISIIKTLSRLWKERNHLSLFEQRLLFTVISWVVLFLIIFSISVYWDLNLFVIWWWIALAVVRWLSSRPQYCVIASVNEKIERAEVERGYLFLPPKGGQ